MCWIWLLNQTGKKKFEMYAGHSRQGGWTCTSVLEWRTGQFVWYAVRQYQLQETLQHWMCVCVGQTVQFTREPLSWTDCSIHNRTIKSLKAESVKTVVKVVNLIFFQRPEWLGISRFCTHLEDGIWMYCLLLWSLMTEQWEKVKMSV